MSIKEKKSEKLGGTGFQPVQTFKVTRRTLPHWQLPGSVYFITWRIKNGKTLDHEERGIVMNALRHWGGSKWTVLAAVVMPDHVHVLAQPQKKSDGGVFDLAEILHSVKRHSARIINKKRG